MLKPANSDPNKNAADRRFIEHPEEFGGYNTIQVEKRIAGNINDSAHKIVRNGKKGK